MSIRSKTGSPSKIRGKVVLVPFPFEDFSTKKVRPASCLSEPIGKFEHIIVAFISSKISDQIEETELEIKPAEVEWQKTGLIVPSVLKLHKIVSLPKNLILRELGIFPIIKMKTLKRKSGKYLKFKQCNSLKVIKIFLNQIQ
ncbi:type II toxin-antitoxin system PemK/MazF family toxin [uncultured Algoriphagus sp.]|jgi:mRNA interferase MazF|uniref:type II toxin-antitoxin system PemK/MazF family toxin n=1 Tax=uncultured Algoriphagus sp. TaxID=417365 RepID=UPI001064B103|nr:type II toxin-antitoxin system PemK/MazF family toxin [uncultured Algoriphagus sp.]